jgi:transposase-like protein
MAEAEMGGEVKNVSVLVAIGVSQSGYRQILAVSEGPRKTRRVGRSSCAA